MICISVLIIVLLGQAKPVPEAVPIETTTEAVSTWPEFQGLKATVPRLDKAANRFILDLPADPFPEPKLHGTDVRDAAQRRARDLVLALAPETAGDPNLWRLQPELPDKVAEEFGVSLARGIPDQHSTTGYSWSDPRARVEFRVRDGVAVPTDFNLGTAAWSVASQAAGSRILGAAGFGSLSEGVRGGTVR